MERMALRLDTAVIRGEIDNTTHGNVRGAMLSCKGNMVQFFRGLGTLPPRELDERFF